MANDLISRQAAIAELNEIAEMKHAILDSLNISDRRAKDMIEAELGQINSDIDSIKNMPSAVVPIKDKCLTCIHCENCTDEQTFEEFMFGQDMGNPEDGSL